jgi:hypothetical protein
MKIKWISSPFDLSLLLPILHWNLIATNYEIKKHGPTIPTYTKEPLHIQNHTHQDLIVAYIKEQK